MLLKGIGSESLSGASLLDIGGGIGALVHELLGEQIAAATLVDAASAHIAAAEAEAERRGRRDRVSFLHGDFVALADAVPAADLVTLDRVVCCYPDFEGLLRASTLRARRWYALTYPRDHLYLRIESAFNNWRRHRRGDPFSTFIHPTARIHALVVAEGFQHVYRRRSFLWEAAVYRRRTRAPAQAAPARPL